MLTGFALGFLGLLPVTDSVLVLLVLMVYFDFALWWVLVLRWFGGVSFGLNVVEFGFWVPGILCKLDLFVATQWTMGWFWGCCFACANWPYVV